MKSFLTGSRAYGTPREDSDVDLVVLVDRPTLDALADLAEKGDPVHRKLSLQDRGENDPGDALRFGRLNLICHVSETVFEAWRRATDELIAKKPVPRDYAVGVIKQRVVETLIKSGEVRT